MPPSTRRATFFSLLDFIADELLQSARELATTVWAHEIALAFGRMDNAMNQLIEQGLEGQSQHLSMIAACDRLRVTFRQLWGPRQNDVFTAECVTKS